MLVLTLVLVLFECVLVCVCVPLYYRSSLAAGCVTAAHTARRTTPHTPTYTNVPTYLVSANANAYLALALARTPRLPLPRTRMDTRTVPQKNYHIQNTI